MRKLERARARAARARARAIALPIALFGVLWLAVFAQMATGNDPALGGSKAAGSTQRPQSDSKTTASHVRRSAPPGQTPPATQLAYDPATGTIVEVPAPQGQGVAPAPAPAPPPAPVTTSQS